MTAIAYETEADMMRRPCDVTNSRSVPHLEPYISAKRGESNRRLMDVWSNGMRDVDEKLTAPDWTTTGTTEQTTTLGKEDR